jgi:LysM repeat protein
VGADWFAYTFRVNVRPLTIVVGLAVLAPFVAAACGDDEARSGATLPAIVTTTTSTSTIAPSTTLVVTYYVIQPGDRLGNIATSFGVTVDAIMELNGITNPDKINAGDKIEIPTGIVVTNTLPTGPVTTLAP